MWTYSQRGKRRARSLYRPVRHRVASKAVAILPAEDSLSLACNYRASATKVGYKVKPLSVCRSLCPTRKAQKGVV